MAENEILDIVDQEGNVIGQAPRHELHQNPKLIHRVVHCWIFNHKGQVLWQQRSMQKVQAPGMWDMSCGGHILSGDTPEESLARELEEELGVKHANPTFIEKYVRGNESQTELIYLYYAIIDQPANTFKLQKEEVEQVEWIDIENAMTLVREGKREATSFIFTQVPKILQTVFAQKA
jgi:isopentenyl-diphosphate delta-isomerase type 1